MSKPKAILFDIGGVCVVSPMQAIFDYELKHGIPKNYINFAISRTSPDGAWHKLERGEIKMDDDFFAQFNADLNRPDLWKQYNRSSSNVPPAPAVDSTTVFWEMMRISRQPDPVMYPALQNLVKSKQFVIGALSNTVIFPPDHPYSQIAEDDPNNVPKLFDVFVSSAHTGLRKPDPAIYKYAIDQLDKFDRNRGGSGITAKDIWFLDDIGQNLKAAREVGLRTIKVNIGRVDEAVKQLEQITGLQLAEQKARL